MSGVLGIYYLDGRKVERSELDGMLARLAPRGYDGSGCWLEGTIGFGHRMMWTTPEIPVRGVPLTMPRPAVLSLPMPASITARSCSDHWTLPVSVVRR